MKRLALATLLLLVLGGGLGVAYHFWFPANRPTIPADDSDSAPGAGAQLAVAPTDLDFGAKVPTSAEAFRPVSFTAKDGKIKGWKVTIPGGLPLATPAIADGKVFVGGGFGSHQFFALDAVTGRKTWEYQTKDDGPTAAVVDDGYVGFNTESCELEILTLAGKPVWKKWLGDPLMSMPAIADGRVYMAYPDSKGGGGHYLACFDVKDGKEYWKKPIAGEIITAPVIAEGRVYLATLDGTLYCFKQRGGELVWQDKKNATSSPVVWHGQCYFSQREEISLAQAGKQINQQTEQLAGRMAMGITGASNTVAFASTKQNADYLDYSKRKSSPKMMAEATAADGAVGFSAPPPAAGLPQAMANLGQGHVSAVWAYQGSKPFVYQERLYSAMGDTLRCVDPKTDKVIWERVVGAKSADNKAEGQLDHVLTPPVLVNDKVVLGSALGEVLCLAAGSGEVLWKASLGEPVVFQPAVANGRVYVPTSTGSLFCLETGDAEDDGWYMWGANAAHNGFAK
jgi:Ca-activated chloride channel family protein